VGSIFGSEITVTGFTSAWAYDGIWAVALGLNATYTHNLVGPLESFAYGDRDMVEEIVENVGKVQFDGTSVGS
jgi:hypothetical protein